ncbi:hypothetical protein ACOI9Y_31695, partial [Mesorhizobium japonicum]
DTLNLDTLPDNYLPRTNYLPACEAIEYTRRVPRVSWVEEGEREARVVTGYYRHVNREMISPSAERSLISALLPKGVGHVHTCISMVFRTYESLIDFHALTLSTALDIFMKSTGAGHANYAYLSRMPIYIPSTSYRSRLHVRVLVLASLTTHYSDLWRDCWQPVFQQDRWVSNAPRLPR